MNQPFTNQLIFSHLLHQPQPFTQDFPYQNPLQTFYSQFQVACNFAPFHNQQSQPYFQLSLPFNRHHDYGIALTYPSHLFRLVNILIKTTMAMANSKNSNKIQDPTLKLVLNKQTLREYILMVMDDDDQIHQISQNLREINQVQLAQTLEILVTKQKQHLKSREELIKFCLRKAFRFIFQKISERNSISKTNLKTARQEFLKIMEQETHIPLVLPFGKNSKNKTMNNDFQKNFYKEFLDHLDDTIQADRKKKINKLQDKIWLSLRENRTTSIDIKRLPWSLKNTERVKSIAFELLTFSENHNK